MDILIRLNNQTVGRDKIIRLFQYGSRAGWYYTQSSVVHCSSSNDILKSLEYTFSSFRKLLRLGRCLDSLYGALLAMKYPNLTIRLTLTLSKIANALFLLIDHIIWIGRAGLLKVNIEKWNRLASKYWILTIIMNLIRDVYEIMQIMEHHNLGRLTKSNVRNFHFDKYWTLFHFTTHKDVFLDTVKNTCDLFIPLTALGYTKLSPGMVGVLGFISSAVGIYCLVDPLAKLTPA